MDWLRRASAWTMSYEGSLGRPPIIGMFAYALNPAETLAAANGGLASSGNFLSVLMVKIAASIDSLKVILNPETDQ